MNNETFYNFSIPGFATQREWSVYIVVGIPTNRGINEKKNYVGKVGDNSNGCSPLITRIGNHLSHYSEHSQLRNKISATTEYNYHVYFATFGQYTAKDKQQLDKVNQLERVLNLLIQSKIKGKKEYELLNPYLGKSFINLTEREKRNGLLIKEDIETLETLAKKAMRKV